jgi:hypothetical protein
MSIVRVGVLVAVVVAVLPADKDDQARLYDRAVSAVRWTATFCDRNGPTCSKASDFWSAFVQKAQFGARMAYELALKHSENDAGAEKTFFDPAIMRPLDGTLKPQDLEPAWRGRLRRDGV